MIHDEPGVTGAMLKVNTAIASGDQTLPRSSSDCTVGWLRMSTNCPAAGLNLPRPPPMAP